MSDKTVLDGDLHRDNVIPFNRFAVIVIDTLNEIVETILPLCGPNAVKDLVIYRGQTTNFANNVFTNDGRHILGSMEYLSPIQTYITNYIKYIADRVDRAASDGTSTAIYLSSKLIIGLLTELLDLHHNCIYSNYTDRRVLINEATLALSNMVTESLERVIEFVDSLRILINDQDEDRRKELIYSLAYTSSKGNEILSRFAVDIFSKIPELLYEQINYRKSPIETEVDLSIEYPDYDFIVSMTPSSNTSYNAALFTEVIHEDCDIVVCPYYLNDDVTIMGYFTDNKPTRKTVLLYSGANDHVVVSLERHLDPAMVTICRHTVYRPAFVNNPIELLCLLAASGYDTSCINNRPSDDFSSMTIRGVKCHIKSNTLKISKMFGSNDGIHPLYGSSTNPGFNQLVCDLENKIKRMKNAHTNADEAGDLTEFMRIYRSLVCSKLPILTIGGSSTDLLANIDVVDDVLGSVSVAMKHGVIFHANHQIMEFVRDNNFGINTMLYSIFSDYVKMTYGNAVDTSTQVTQSYKSVVETFGRLIETVPKIISIDRVIVPNTVTTKD